MYVMMPYDTTLHVSTLPFSDAARCQLTSLTIQGMIDGAQHEGHMLYRPMSYDVT